MARIVPATSHWLRIAADALAKGALVAFPTETVYGLGANALDPAAVARIFVAKGRPANNPIIVHVASADGIDEVAEAMTDEERELARRFWPGPLTLVLSKSAKLPGIVTAGGATVGVRVPRHPVALELIRFAGVPVAAPSANRSESVSPTTAEHVRRSLGEGGGCDLDLILDGGACAVGLESTVVRMQGGIPTILRPGAIAAAAIRAAVGLGPSSEHDLFDVPDRQAAIPVRAAVPSDPWTEAGAPAGGDLGLDAVAAGDDAPLASPGRMPRHYAPRARLVLCDDALVAAQTHGRGAAALTHVAPHASDAPAVPLIVLSRDPAGYARGLYAALRDLDDTGAETVYVTAPPAGGEWSAILDRLTRASTSA